MEVDTLLAEEPAAPSQEPMQEDAPTQETPTEFKSDGPPVFKCFYNGVVVYEMFVDGRGVMRRERDNYVNATHLLSVAGLSKGQRTKELEVYTAEHTDFERVQGGFGRYQGTWIPMEQAIEYAKAYRIYDDVLPLFTATAETVCKDPIKKPGTYNKSREIHARSRTSSPTKRRASRAKHMGTDASDFDLIHQRDIKISKDYSSIRDLKAAPAAEASVYKRHESPIYRSLSQMFSSPLKSAGDVSKQSDFDEIEAMIKKFSTLTVEERRNKVIMNIYEEGDDKELYALLCYPSSSSFDTLNFDVDMIIDDLEHTPLHWAASIASLPKVQWLMSHGADQNKANHRGESVLMRAISSVQNSESDTFPDMLKVLADALFLVDKLGQTLLHHIVSSFKTLDDLNASMHYLNVFLEYVKSLKSANWTQMFLNAQDLNGNTALHLAYELKNDQVINRLIENGCAQDIRNNDLKLPVEMSVSF